jgi:putative membrane protein
MMGDMGWMMGPGWMTAAMVGSVLFGLALLALVIVGVIAGIQWLVGGSAGPATTDPRDRALTLLRERYARGEISRDEFQRMREDLTERMTSGR